MIKVNFNQVASITFSFLLSSVLPKRSQPNPLKTALEKCWDQTKDIRRSDFSKTWKVWSKREKRTSTNPETTTERVKRAEMIQNLSTCLGRLSTFDVRLSTFDVRLPTFKWQKEIRTWTRRRKTETIFSKVKKIESSTSTMKISKSASPNLEKSSSDQTRRITTTSTETFKQGNPNIL